MFHILWPPACTNRAVARCALSTSQNDYLLQAVAAGNTDWVAEYLQEGVAADPIKPSVHVRRRLAAITATQRAGEDWAFCGVWHTRTRHHALFILLHVLSRDPCCLRTLLCLLLTQSALQLSARAGDVPTIKALVNGGADVNRVCDEGCALCDAAAYGRDEAVTCLIELKANPSIDWVRAGN
jgi:hypothetical protein